MLHRILYYYKLFLFGSSSTGGALALPAVITGLQVAVLRWISIFASQSGCSCNLCRCALKNGEGVGPDHCTIVYFWIQRNNMFQLNMAAWKSNHIILLDSNIVLHNLDVMMLQFFSSPLSL